MNAAILVLLSTLATSTSSDAPCAPESRVPAPLASPGAVLLLGEVHGTRELPAFFGEVVCDLRPNQPKRDTPGIFLFDRRSPEGFEGAYSVDSLTASAPAVPKPPPSDR